jgi:hypothetical protein
MPRKSNPVKAFRRNLYKTARIIGDITAMAEGNFHKRLFRRLTGRVASRGLGSIFRSFFK